jgi:hypothetical protein
MRRNPMDWELRMLLWTIILLLFQIVNCTPPR